LWIWLSRVRAPSVTPKSLPAQAHINETVSSSQRQLSGDGAEALERQINYRFSNPRLLFEALTHPSLAYETQGPHFDNQRLEFLGDAVLQLVLTRELFLALPDLDEGTLTKLRSQMVSRPALQKCAERLGLGTYILMGKGEEASGGRTRPSSLADALEALIGAIYLDSGLNEAATFILSVCAPELVQMDLHPDQLNPKGQLQEIIQSAGSSNPVYSIISQEGPDHCKIFVAKVEWNSHLLATGMGPSKKQAETAAAREALLHPLVAVLKTPKPPLRGSSGRPAPKERKTCEPLPQN
jgi:ribonuclease-3